MSRQAVGEALEAMQDDSVRERLAAGEFDASELVRLDDHEQGLVQRAATDYPEVLPFFTLIEHTQGGLSQANPGQLLPAVQMGGPWSDAFNYALPSMQQGNVGGS